MISIIVPVYDVEKYINRCLESIVAQTYKELEIILVDDGSPDNCPAICDQWAERDERIKVIHKENGGLSSARNTALDIAKGEYLYFVDSDDYIVSDLCERILLCFEHYDADIVTFDSYVVDEKAEILGSTETISDGLLSRKDALLLLMKGYINNYAWNKMYKRKVFEGVRFPEGRVWEDVATTYKLFLNSKSIYCCADKFYYYVQRSGSIIHSLNIKTLEDIYLARHEVFAALENDYPQAAKEAFSLAVLSARRLYDRSLWEKADATILEQSIRFVNDNKERILKTQRDIKTILFLNYPRTYKALRCAKHVCGNIVKKLRKG